METSPVAYIPTDTDFCPLRYLQWYTLLAGVIMAVDIVRRMGIGITAVTLAEMRTLVLTFGVRTILFDHGR